MFKIRNAIVDGYYTYPSAISRSCRTVSLEEIQGKSTATECFDAYMCSQHVVYSGCKIGPSRKFWMSETSLCVRVCHCLQTAMIRLQAAFRMRYSTRSNKVENQSLRHSNPHMFVVESHATDVVYWQSAVRIQAVFRGTIARVMVTKHKVRATLII